MQDGSEFTGKSAEKRNAKKLAVTEFIESASRSHNPPREDREDEKPYICDICGGSGGHHFVIATPRD